MPKETVIPDGAWDWSGGVNSDAVTTVRSDLIPHGLRRDQVAWLSNGTIRGGVLSPRSGYVKLFDFLPGGLWQGGIMYEPVPDNVPFLICSISGRIYKASLEAPYTVTDLSATFGLSNPATVPQAFFAQGNGIVVIQSGDGATLPLFYYTVPVDTLRRSNGLTGNATNPNISELPAGYAMVYYQGRIWYQTTNLRVYTAGDMEGNSVSGTAAYRYLDSILSVTENPLAFGGDGFIVPSAAGNIRALGYTANIDTTLGQGPLYIFTRKQVYSLQVPPTRADWIAATSANQPIQTVAQINNGAVGEDGIVHVNGDLFYQGIEPSIRSLTVATRWYGQWGNVPISNNVNRALQFNDRSVLRRASGAYFDNRLLQGCLPKQTVSGVVTPGLLPLDFDTISTLDERVPPAWEGMWEGLDMLKLFTGDFGGRPRCFAPIVSRLDGSIDLYELTDYSKVDDNGTDHDIRIQWYAEFPAFTWGKEFELKQLRGGELWVDRVSGTVDFDFYYRPDADACWHLWYHTQLCSARNCAEDVNCPVAYPPQDGTYGEGYRFPITLPEPPAECETMNRRPSVLGFQHQPKVAVKGSCRIRGIILWAEIKERALYDGLACSA